jgi:hypothetical protein
VKRGTAFKVIICVCSEAAARTADNYTFDWTYTGDGSGQDIANFRKTVADEYEFNRITFLLDTTDFNNSNLYDGAFGRAIRGFTQEEIDESPWLRDGVSAEDNGGEATEARTASPTALSKGQYVGPSEMANTLNGTLKITVAPGVIRDWSGNELTNPEIDVQLMPWFGQVYRSPERGITFTATRKHSAPASK